MRLQSITFLFLIQTAILSAQNWEEFSPFAGTARDDGVAFVIDGIAYAGSGREVGFGYTNDFFKYDPSFDQWTQIASLPSVGRQYCGRFTIADTGYVVCGVSPDDYLQELWAYYAHSDTWEQKASFPGEARSSPVAFAISGKGYVGTGREVNEYFGDFWEYDPQTDSWTQLDDFAGGDRFEAIGMTIGPFAYVGLGRIEDRTFANDWWKFNPDTKTWSQLSDYPGLTRFYAVEASNDRIGVLAGGMSAEEEFLNEVFVYEPLSDTWTELPDIPIDGIRGCFGFMVEDNFYLGTGLDSNIERRDEVFRIDLQNQDDLRYQVFPIPFGDSFTIFSETNSMRSIKLFDLSGKEILQQDLKASVNFASLSLNYLPSSVLILEITWDNGEITKDRVLKLD